MKKIKNLFSKEKLVNYVLIFYVLSILLDLHVFYNSISTLIRVGIITILFLIIFFRYATKKEQKILLVYFGTLATYILFHIANTFNFEIPFFLDYDTLPELLYFVKMAMNVLLIFVVYKLDIDKKNFYKVISISAFLISGSIIVCNLFKIGYTSYDFNQITYNIIDWFKTDNVAFAASSSKGYFHLTNQISAILILYLPLLLIKLKEKIKLINIINIMMVIISLYMLGTRVSSYSPFIILILTFIIYVINSIIEGEFKKVYALLIVIFTMISYGLYSFCPLLSRNVLYDSMFNPEASEEEVSESVTENKPINEMTNEEFREYLTNFNISPDFYNSHYPLEQDRKFYEYYVSLGTTKINDIRFLETEIIKRVKNLNDNYLDTFFGLGYDRVINIFNIESDYIMQYYSIGIIGCILILGVNILLLVYMYFKTLFNLKRYFTFENIMIMFTSTYFLATTYFTGNVLNSISGIIPISFVIGYNLSRINNMNKTKKIPKNEYYLGFKTTTKSMDEVVNKVFKEREQTIIYNINPLIVNNFLNNKEVREEFNKGKYNIPDGNGIVLVSKLTSNNIKQSVPGIEVMERICEASVSHKYSIYLYGAKEDSVSKSKLELEEKYKKINIVGYTNGYTDEKLAIKDILNKKPDILFVALGSPKQEEFIIRNKEVFKNIKIIMPVGGSFDVISKNLERAPKIFRRLKLEWLYRMLKEPKRFKQIFGMIKFVLLVLFMNFWYNEKEN